MRHFAEKLREEYRIGLSYTWIKTALQGVGWCARSVREAGTAAARHAVAPGWKPTPPAPDTENDNTNPPRVSPRNLFDMALGDDDLFHGDRFKWSARVIAINLTNKYAVYNFLSTFSGTHYVTPRAVMGEIGFHF